MDKSKLIWKKLNRFNRLMVSGLLGLMFVISLNTATQAQTPAQSCKTATKPCAEFKRIWVDYDVTEGERKGMRIHTQFDVYRMKNVASAIAVFFETGDGKRLRDKNKSYYTMGGDVTVQRDLKIDYDPGVYSDLTVFMPYSELDLEPGEYDLKMDVDLIYKNGTTIQHLTFENFVFTQPDTTPKVDEAPLPPSDDTPTQPTTTQKVTVEKVWGELDAVERGVRGVRLHINFTVNGMKNVESQLRIRVARSTNEEFLTSTNPAYTGKNGELVVFKLLKPGFDKTEFQDMQVFLPFDEIKIGKGVFNLKMDIDLVNKNEEVIQHMDWYPFVFRKQ